MNIAIAGKLAESATADHITAASALAHELAANSSDQSWGETFRAALAAFIQSSQSAAQLAEASGHHELAEAIRRGDNLNQAA